MSKKNKDKKNKNINSYPGSARSTLPSDYHSHEQKTSCCDRQGHVQLQECIFRSEQASRQMVYEVYGNCLTMLEELESRELGHQGTEALPRSAIYLPCQRRYDDSTIKRKLEAQLLLFQTQLVSCDKNIKEGARQELIVKTLAWFSQREARGIPQGTTDHFTFKLYEVLTRGKTQHPEEFNQRPTINKAEMQEVMQGIVEGNYRRDMLDEDFKKKPDKKAELPITRGAKELTVGAERLARLYPELKKELRQYSEISLR